MNDTAILILLIITAAVSAVAAAAAIIAIIKISAADKNSELRSLEQKVDALSKSLGDEFSRGRIEQANNNKNLRDGLAKSIDDMSFRVDSMNKSNFEHREKVNEMLINMRDKNAEQSDRQNKVLESSITRMQESNEKKLEQMRLTVDEKLTSTLTTRIDSSFKTVSSQLENLYKSLGEMQTLSTGVTENVTALNRVLTNVKTRGTWAEVQLEGILNQTIPNMFDKNIATVKGSSERVEFAIRIPASDSPEHITYLPVDSKFPLEDYIRLCDAADRADPEAVAKARKELEARVQSEAKTISKYISVPDTTPFAIMYLATEGLYAEIASSRTGLPEKLQSEYNIMIAGPTTITALLNSLSMGFKTVAINEKANEVRKLLAVAKAQYDNFATLLEKARKKVDEAGKTLDDAQHRNTIIRKKLKNIEDIESGEAEQFFLDNTSNGN